MKTLFVLHVILAFLCVRFAIINIKNKRYALVALMIICLIVNVVGAITVHILSAITF